MTIAALSYFGRVTARIRKAEEVSCGSHTVFTE